MIYEDITYGNEKFDSEGYFIIVLTNSGENYYETISNILSEVKPILRNYFENNSYELNLPHFPQKFRNLHQCILHVAATEYQPYTFLSGANETFYFDGLDAIVLKELSRILNFSIVVLPYNGGFLSKHVIAFNSFLPFDLCYVIQNRF